MRLNANRILTVASAPLVITLFTAPLAAQANPRPTERATPPAILNPAYDSSLYTSPTATSSRFKGIRWRLVGPFRGGRAVAVAGDPSRRLVFYFGAVNGGVWKTTNGGQTWRNVTDGVSDISSVGAISVAPSDPNVISTYLSPTSPSDRIVAKESFLITFRVAFFRSITTRTLSLGPRGNWM